MIRPVKVICLLLCAATVAFGDEPVKVKARKKTAASAVFHVGLQTKPRELDLDNGIPEVYTAPGYYTTIEIPEEIKQFGVGDADRWTATCVVGLRPGEDAGGKNLCGIKPGDPPGRTATGKIASLDEHKGNQSTNLTLMAAHGIYSFSLVPATKDHPVDSVAFVRAAPGTLLASMGGAGLAPGFIPAAELTACRNAAERAERASNDIALQRDAARREAAARITPKEVGLYRIGGWWKSSELVVFSVQGGTYIETAGRPQIYEFIGGKRERVNAVCASGACFVDHVINHGSVKLDKKEVKFKKIPAKGEHHA